jgi:hypothetical protein
VRWAERSWPGGEVSMQRVAMVREFCGRDSAAMAACAAVPCGALVPVTSAAVNSGALIALQRTDREWQHAEARAQGCCADAACRGWSEVASLHSMPQFAPASGASTSRRINARASWARRSTWLQFSLRRPIPSACTRHGATRHQGQHSPRWAWVPFVISAAVGRGRAAVGQTRRRAAKGRSARPGCAE